MYKYIFQNLLQIFNDLCFSCTPHHPYRVQRCEHSGILPPGAQVQVLQPSILPTDVLQDLPRTLTSSLPLSSSLLLHSAWANNAPAPHSRAEQASKGQVEGDRDCAAAFNSPVQLLWHSCSEFWMTRDSSASLKLSLAWCQPHIIHTAYPQLQTQPNRTRQCFPFFSTRAFIGFWVCDTLPTFRDILLMM